MRQELVECRSLGVNPKDNKVEVVIDCKTSPVIKPGCKQIQDDGMCHLNDDRICPFFMN